VKKEEKFRQPIQGNCNTQDPEKGGLFPFGKKKGRKTEWGKRGQKKKKKKKKKTHQKKTPEVGKGKIKKKRDSDEGRKREKKQEILGALKERV